MRNPASSEDGATDSGWWFPPGDPSPDDWIHWANSLPIVRALGLKCHQVGERSATFGLSDVPLTPNPNGAVNGGLVVSAADQVMGVLAARVAPPGYLPVTAALHTQFHSPALVPLTLSGQVIGGGRRLSFVDVLVTDVHGNRCAMSHGTMTATAPAHQAS